MHTRYLLYVPYVLEAITFLKYFLSFNMERIGILRRRKCLEFAAAS
jgi:hypothetical protein